LAVSSFCLPVTALASNFLFKVGSFHLDDENLNQLPFASDPIRFEQGSSVAYGVEWEFMFGNNLAGSIELYKYEHDWASILPAFGNTGTVSTDALLWNFKYYFGDSKFRPFIGAGLGFKKITAPFGITAEATSAELVFQGLVGIKYQLGENLGIFAELKGTFGTDDATSSGVTTSFVDTDGQGVFLGISVGF
jgi:outer membrane protein W